MPGMTNACRHIPSFNDGKDTPCFVSPEETGMSEENRDVVSQGCQISSSPLIRVGVDHNRSVSPTRKGRDMLEVLLTCRAAVLDPATQYWCQWSEYNKYHLNHKKIFYSFGIYSL